VVSFICDALCSLGCGIGYGYLHRIPTVPFTQGKTLNVQHAMPPPASGDAVIDFSKPVPPASTSGFAEVSGAT